MCDVLLQLSSSLLLSQERLGRHQDQLGLVGCSSCQWEAGFWRQTYTDTDRLGC